MYQCNSNGFWWLQIEICLLNYCFSFWWLTEAFGFSEGESLTWNKPPPKQTVQANLFRPSVHLSSRELHEATINASLIWQFTLTALNFTGLYLSFNGTFFGNIGPLAVLHSKLKHRFGLDWNHNQSIIRLIIFNVTSEETGTYSCKVLAKGLWDYEFESNVQVDVVNVKVDDVGKLKVKSRNTHTHTHTYIYIYNISANICVTNLSWSHEAAIVSPSNRFDCPPTWRKRSRDFLVQGAYTLIRAE